MAASSHINVEFKKHHIRQELCKTRAKYRQGKEETSVKVYTINDESKYLLIQRVPSLNLEKELNELCSKYGQIEELKLVNEYPLNDRFSQTFMVKFKKLSNAIFAKKHLDDISFMGQELHICYAPELENVKETWEKLSERRRWIQKKCRKIEKEKAKQYTERTENRFYNCKLVKQSLIYQWENDTADKKNNETPIKNQTNELVDIRLKVKTRIEQMNKPERRIRWKIKLDNQIK